MPRRLIACLPFLAVVISCASHAVHAAESFMFPPAGKFVLPPAAAPEMFKQCARAMPTDTGGYWAPSLPQIETLERSLKGFLAERERARAAVPLKGARYHRQYVGFTRKGVKYIYGNFYSERAADAGKYENKRAVVTCDGDNTFWGVVYRPDTGKLEDLKLNAFVSDEERRAFRQANPPPQ